MIETNPDGVMTSLWATPGTSPCKFTDADPGVMRKILLGRMSKDI
jgi:hypothetical protein